MASLWSSIESVLCPQGESLSHLLGDIDRRELEELPPVQVSSLSLLVLYVERAELTCAATTIAA